LSAHLLSNEMMNKESSTYLNQVQQNHDQFVPNVTVKQYVKQSESMKRLKKLNSNENVKVVESPRDPGEMISELLN
jgi:hypothetical protein